MGIFPHRDSLVRLVGAVLAEQHDEWTEGRRHLGLDVLARGRVRLVPDTAGEEVPTTAQALPARAPRRPRGASRTPPWT